MLNVLLTVDTEFWPRRPYARPCDYVDDFRRDIYGETPQGEFGLRFQIDLLDALGLRAVFLVEALHAYAVGTKPLQEVVSLVEGHGHDVQLHAHSEWLNRMAQPLLPGRTGQHLRHFSVGEQAVLIDRAAAMLRQCGAEGVCAFRAGNFGANLDTLRALARNKIPYDTSHNACCLDTACHMPTHEPLEQPRTLDGVVEFPVTCFLDSLGRNRPLQLGACSAGEMEHGLWQALRKGWDFAVIVSHSFELIRGRSEGTRPASPDFVVVRRFERLCRFLHKHREVFPTVTFSDVLSIDPSKLPTPGPLRSRPLDTATRLVEQFRSRCLW